MSSNGDPAIFRVLVADAISDEGIEKLRGTPGIDVTVKTGMDPDELKRTIGDYEALIVRSATKVTADVLAQPGRLRAIGRAGTGVDNIDLPAATQAGVVVMNTPGGNSVAAAELTMAHLTSLARNVPQANSELRQGRWERKKYLGVELAGKVLGLVGMGRIGREVARRAQGFRMEVIGYDPYVDGKAAENLGVRFTPLADLIAQADFISLHVPLNDSTRHVIDGAAIERMKPGAAVINCARGGLIDEKALLDAVRSGHLSGAAMDVFESEPPSDLGLVEHPKIIATPHLGASTREAQVRVGTEIAEKICVYLKSGTILDAVNFPSIGREDFAVLGPIMDLAERLGSFLAQVVEGGFRRFGVQTQGSFGEQSLKPIVMAATKGLLEPVLHGAVSYVNALSRAAQRDITVDEGRSTSASAYSGLLRLTLETEQGSTTVAGTLMVPDRPRLVEVDGVSVEAHPDGRMLFCRNLDRPGVVGQLGTILGRAEINIAGIQLGRPQGDDRAVSIIKVDGPLPPGVLDEIRSIEQILLARAVSI